IFTRNTPQSCRANSSPLVFQRKLCDQQARMNSFRLSEKEKGLCESDDLPQGHPHHAAFTQTITEFEPLLLSQPISKTPHMFKSTSSYWYDLPSCSVSTAPRRALGRCCRRLHIRHIRIPPVGH